MSPRHGVRPIRWSVKADRDRRGRVRQLGIGMTECLIAVPLLLVLGLGAWQWILVLQARQLLEHAAYEAARAGALGHASEHSIDQGLARGLVVYWSIGQGRDPEARQDHSIERLAEARRGGQLEWRQLGPTRGSFQDWAEPAIDPKGRPIEGLREIPIDNLDARIAGMRPVSGIAGWLGREPIGQASGQTLRDASVLRIELQVAVPLRVPVAGWLIAKVARAAGACHEPCLVSHHARDPSVRDAGPHLPLRVHAEVRMQSPARLSTRTPERRQFVAAATAAPFSHSLPPSSPQGRPEPDISSGADASATSEPGGGTTQAPDHEADRDTSSPARSPIEAASPSQARARGAASPGPSGSDPPADEGEIWSPGACGIQPG